jgi:hypothetical protein
MLSVLRSAVVFGFASALVVLAMPGCSQQGEGDRCDNAKNGNEDCESGLTCVVSKNLLNKDIGDRCCPPTGVGSNSRCTRGSGTDAGGTGGGSSGGSSGNAGDPGTETGGTNASGGTEPTGGTTATGGTDSGGTASGAPGAAGAAGGGD